MQELDATNAGWQRAELIPSSPAPPSRVSSIPLTQGWRRIPWRIPSWDAPPDSHGLCASLASRATLRTESNSQKQRECRAQTLSVSAWPRERVAWRVGGLVRWDPLMLRYGAIGEEPNHRRIERCSREKSPEAHWGFDPPDRPGSVSCVWHSLFQRLPIRSESARGLVSVADGFA